MTVQPYSATTAPLEPRHIKTINVVGLVALFEREITRFLSVYMQTVIEPVISTLLYYAVFALAFGGQVKMVGHESFLAFLAPGLIMMTMVQNSFSNASSSLMIAKMQGNIVDILMPPLSSFELLAGFTLGSVFRGLAVGLATGIGLSLFAPMSIHSVFLIIAFALLGNMMLGTLGLAAGLWSDKFDQLATVSNFIVTPLTFLSGTFYSINSLPESWHVLALYNPFFYMINGFRSGFTGHADGNVVFGLLFLLVINIILSSLTLWILRTGYKIKS